VIRVRKIAVIFLVLGFFCIGFSNQLNSVIPSMDAESVTVTMIFNDTVTDYNIQSNPSKTIYSLALNGVNGRDMNLPLRMGPVEGLWTRQDPKRLSVNIALLIPTIDDPEVTIRDNVVTLRFFRSKINVDIEKFTTYGMTVSTAMTYLFSEEMLDLSYVISPSVRNEEVIVGFSLAMPEDILRNILTSLGDRIAYSYLTDGTFYLGTPEEIKDLVNAFWKTYIGVEFNAEGESISEQIERLRKTLPVNSFIEYLPNEASLMVFGDLQTHMTLSAALTTNTVTREYNVPWEIANIDIEPLTAYYELARKLNATLFSDGLTIASIPEFNKLIFSGNAAQVDALYEYIDLYREYITSQDLDSSKTSRTITLPDNFFLIEDILKLGSASGSGLTEDKTLVGTIFSILQSYAMYEDLSVDRTFEPIGKVTFELPNYLVPVLQKVADSFSEISTDVSYTIVNYHLTIEESILSQVQRITGAAIEALGERKGFIIKGSKSSIGTAEYLLSLFTGIAFEDYANTYLELKANDSFEEVSAFLRTFYAAQGLVEGEYTVEQIADRLVFMYAPSEIMEKAVAELEQHEKQIYRITRQSILEISPEVYTSGLGELLQTILVENETANFIESAGLLVISAYPDRLLEIESVIEERIPRITEMVENRISSQDPRLSLQIMAIPGWDIEKFRAYLNDFLGSDIYSEITLTTSGSGYIVIASQPVLEAISTEAEKLRGFENPSYRLETSIPSLAQFELLLEKLGIAVTIVPVENQFMIVGSKENVEEASKLVRQISSGLPVQGDVSDTAVDYEFTFINLPYSEVEGISELLSKLSLSVEFVDTPTGVAVVATKERLEKAMEVINSVLSRIETIETGPRSYSLIDIEPDVVGSLSEILSRLGYEIDLVETPAGIVGVGVESQLAKAKSIVEEILKKETSTLPQQGDGDRSYLIISSKPEIEIASLNSVINVFSFDLVVTPVYDKIVVVGDSYDLQLFKGLYNEILTSESVEGAFVSKELLRVPGWDSDRLLSYLGVVLGVEKTTSVSLVQTARGYIVNCPQSVLESVESEFERLRSIESPSYSIERRMPTLDEMNSLLLRLGIIVDILKVDDYFVIVGSSTSVEQAKELVSRLLEVIGDESETKQTAFEVSSISSEDMPAFTEIFASIGIEVKLLDSPSGILIIGNDDEVTRAVEVADSILEKRASTVDSEILFEFVPVSSDEIEDYSLIFEKMGLNAELLSSPSGVIVIGSSEEVVEAKSVVKLIAEQKQQFDTTEEKRNDSTFVRRVAGWSDEVFSSYLRDFLNEDQYSRISISPSVSGYIVAGPVELLQSIEVEVSRLQEIQDPHFVVQRGLPPLDQLEILIQALGIKVEIIPVEDKYLIVGNRESVVQTNQIIDQLIEAIYQEGKWIEDTSVSKTFIFLPVRPEDAAPLETVMERLGITSELIQISTGIIAVGSEKELLKALDVVESVMAHSESVTAELELNYRFVDVRSDSIEQLLPIIERLNIEIELLETPTGVVAIGAEPELDRAEELIEAINSRAAEDLPLQDKYESYLLLPLSAGITVESLEPALELLDYRVFAVSVADKIIAIGNEEDLLKFRALYMQLQAVEVDREERISLDIKAIPGWDIARISEYLRLFLGTDDFDRISIVPSSTGFVALSPRALIESVEAEIFRLREFENPAFTVLERIPPVDDLEGLLSRLGVLVDLVSMGSSTIVIGSSEDVQRTSQIMEQLLKSVSQDVNVPETVEYSVLDISGEDIGSFNAILERLAIEVSLLTSPSGVIAIGSQEALERTVAVVDDVLSRRTTTQVYEPMYAFTGIQSKEIDSYQAILDKLGADVELLPSATGVLMIGDRDKVETAIKTVNAILEREALVAETEGEKVRVSNVASVVPGWSDEKYASYFMDFLGEDDFSRLSITPSSSGYIVVGPLEVISRLVTEANRLAGIEDPFFVIETSLPAIDQLDTLLERLGLKVTILPVGDKHLVVGMKENVEKTVELIKMLRNGLEAPEASRKYDYIIMPASEGTFETIRQVLSELKIDATALSFGSNVIIVGYGEDLESAADVVISINEKTASLETDEELMYSFTEIPNDRIEEFRAILESLAIDIELLSSPSGVIAIGSQQAVSRTVTVVEDILSRRTTSQVYEPIYAFTGIPSADIESYQTILDKLNAGVELLPSATGVLMIGDGDKVQEAVKTVNAILEREALFDESEGQPDRVSNVAALVPGWNDEKYASYFTDFLGVDDFSRISITPSTSGYIVIGPEEVVSRLVDEASRLAGIEDPFFVIEDSLPAIDQLDTLLDRLGLKVTILPVENKYLIVGIKESVEKTVELIKMLRSGVETPISSRKYDYLIMPANEGSFETIRQVLTELKIDATALSFGSNVILVGYGEDLEDAASVVNSINERTVILETDRELKYSFTEIPNDRIDEFTAILDSLKLDVELLSSPSGVVLVGTEKEAEEANEVIRSVLSKAEQDETIESRFFNNPAGWEEGKLVAYLRGFLGEKDWAKVSATPVQSGYLLVGPSEILNRIHLETVRLAGLEKPYYEIVETVPSIQNLQGMLEKMGLAVTVITVDGRSMVIGPESDVLQTVKVFGELAEGIVLPRGDEPDVFDFVEIPSEEVESFRTIFARLGIRVDLLGTPTGVIVVGQKDSISKALETITSILSRREVQVVNGEQSYMVVEIRDGFDLASAQSVISAFSIDVYPLSVAGKLVIIGAEKELGRFVQIRNDIISEHKVTVIVPREVTIEELSGIISTLGLEMSVLEIRGSFVVYGKEGEIEQVRDILSRLTSDEPSEKTQEMRIFTGIYQNTDFLNQLLSNMGSSLKIYGESDRIVAVGSAEDIGMFESLMQEIGSEPSAVELTAEFYPKLEGWTGETLAEFFRAMNFAVEVFHESSKGYLLIGPADELNRVPDVMDGLELRTKRLTTLYPVPSGMTYEELREILVSAGFSLSYTKLGQSMSISGLEDDVNMAVALLDEVIRSGLGKGVSYRLIELPVDLTLEKLEKIMSDMALNISSVQVDGEVMLIGPDSDLRTAKEIVEYLTPEDPSVDEQRIYSVIPLGEGLSLAEISDLVDSLSLSVEILPVGGDVVVIGTESNVERFRELISSISATLGIGSVESPEYSIVEKVEEISIDQFRELLSSLNLPVKIVEVSDYLVFIGSGESNGKAVDLFSRFETEDKEPIAEEIEFTTLSLPEGFDLNSLSTIFDKLDFKVDLNVVGNVLLLIGAKDSIESAQALLEKLVQVSTGESGERNVFEILEPKEGVSAELLNQLFRLIGIDVEILEGDTALVFVGSRTNVGMALEVYDSLGKTAEVDEGPISYTITILPKNLTPGQLETAFDSIQIPVGVIEAGDYAIIVGTKPSLARAQELVSSLRIGIDASGTSADGSISYVTFALPEGTEIEQFATIAGLMELKLKFEPVGDRVFMIGTGEDIGEFEQVLNGLVSEKAGIVNEFRFAKRLSGIDAETLETYLLAKEISLSGVFDVSGGYLIIGTRESIDEAQAVIDYLADNQQVHFAYVDLPSTLTPEVLQAMVNELMLEVTFTQITQSRYLLIGEINDIDSMKSILSDAVVGESKFLDYEIIIVSKEFNDYLVDERIREDLDNSLNSIGVSTYIGKFDDRLLIVGEKAHVDVAKKLISELDEASTLSQLTEKVFIEDLPSVSGWSIEQITQFLESAEIHLRSIIEYSGRLIGIGTQVGLENARAALSILAVDSKRESVRIEKNLVTETQLREIISKLDLKVEFVDLERQWLLIGEPESLMIITRTVEEAAADKEISRYITDLTVNPQELADLLRESIEGITVQTFTDLQMLLIKSKSSVLLDAAEKMVRDVQESRKAIDPLEKGIVVTGSTVRINVADQDLESLLRLVAEKLGVSLLFVDEIVENATMSIEGLTWDGLVKVINATKPIEISKIDDIYAVTKKEQKAGEEPTDVELVYRVYHNVEEVTRLIEFYGGEVLSDPVNGYIVVRGLAKSRVDNIFDEIGSSLAQPKKQVRIETRLVDKSIADRITRELTTEFDVNNAEVLVKSGSIDLNFKLIDYLDITQLIDDIVNTATLDVNAKLSDGDTDSDLISSPSIVSVSGQEAKIHIGDTIPYLVRTIEYVEGIPIEIETIEYLNTGVELRITPTVNDDGKILLDLYIKVSEPEKYEVEGRVLYGEKTREAQSRLIISNGNTLTIGGLVNSNETITLNKMPFLSDLPFIGKLFTTENRTSDKRELVIFITAEVVEP